MNSCYEQTFLSYAISQGPMVIDYFVHVDCMDFKYNLIKLQAFSWRQKTNNSTGKMKEPQIKGVFHHPRVYHIFCHIIEVKGFESTSQNPLTEN